MSITVDADGSTWFSGEATCLLVANVPKVIGGMEVFPDADPENGTLEVGLVTAHGLGQWAKVLMDVRGRARRHRALRASHPSSRARREDEGFAALRARRWCTSGGQGSALLDRAGRDQRHGPRGRAVSTANLVPETRDLTGDDAFKTLRRNWSTSPSGRRVQAPAGGGRLQPCSVARVPERARRRSGHDRPRRPRERARATRRSAKRWSPSPGGPHPARQVSCSPQRRAKRSRPATATRSWRSRSASQGACSPPRPSSGSSNARSIASTASRPIARPRRSTALRSCSLSSSARSSRRGSPRSRTAGSTLSRSMADSSTLRGRSSRWPLGIVLAAGGLALLSKWSPRRQPAALVVAGLRSARRHLPLARCHRAARCVLPLELDVRRDLRTACWRRRLGAVGAAVICRAALRRRGERPARGREGAGVRAARHREGRRVGARGGSQSGLRGAGDQCPMTPRLSCAARSRASSASLRRRATRSTCSATASRSSRRCSKRSTARSARSTS